MEDMQTELVIFQQAGQPVEVRLDTRRDTVWLSQRQMADLFETSSDNISLHLKNIFADGELSEAATAEESSVVRQEGKRRVTRKVGYYNLDAIISVGYRVSSKRAVQFRQWATRVLREHLTQGYTLNRQRLEANARELEAALQLVKKAAQSPELLTDTGRGLVDIVTRYAQTFPLLQRYDEGLLTEPPTVAGGTLPAPDGYTLLFTAGAHTINPAVYRKLPYDTLRDFTPISHIANSSGLVIVVHPSFPARSLQELIDMARADPGKVIYASAGHGNLTHIAGEMFQVMAGVKLNHVPYKSAGPAVNDLLGGQIPLMFGPSPVVVPMVQAGRLRPLAFTGLKRSAQLPALSTVDELGIKGYAATGWYGIHGPRGTPKAIVDRLSAKSRCSSWSPTHAARCAAR